MNSLNCPCCLNRYDLAKRLPRTLPCCGHSLCSCCIEKGLNSKSIKCPVHDIRVQVGSLNHCHVNHALVGVLEEGLQLQVTGNTNNQASEVNLNVDELKLLKGLSYKLTDYETKIKRELDQYQKLLLNDVQKGPRFHFISDFDKKKVKGAIKILIEKEKKTTAQILGPKSELSRQIKLKIDMIKDPNKYYNSGKMTFVSTLESFEEKLNSLSFEKNLKKLRERLEKVHFGFYKTIDVYNLPGKQASFPTDVPLIYDLFGYFDT